MKLTEKAIRALAAPDPSGKQKLYWDDEPKGFGVLCSGVTRTKTFILQRPVNGKTRRITIAPVLGVAGEVEAARSKAREKLADFFYKGIDPKADPAGARSARRWRSISQSGRSGHEARRATETTSRKISRTGSTGRSPRSLPRWSWSATPS